MWPVLHLPFLGSPVVVYELTHQLAWVSCIALAIWLNRRQGIAPWLTVAIGTLCVVAAVWGARALDMLEYSAVYESYQDLLDRRGSSIYGALLASFAVVWVATRLARVSPLAFLDTAGPCVALGDAISRLGCFAAGCCYGVPWNGPWAVTFPPGSLAAVDQQMRGLLPPGALRSLAVHPVQLYNALIEVVVFAALLRMFPRPHPKGQVFFAFLVAYGALRLALAPFRMEALSSMRAFSVAFMGIGVLGLLAIRRPRFPVPRREAAPGHRA